MKKIFALTVAFIAGIALTANAGSITPGQMTKCNDAASIRCWEETSFLSI